MSSYEPGSRAITIPVHPNSLRAATSTRQTRSKILARSESSEAGPSSLSSRDSSYSSPTQSSAFRHKPSCGKPGHYAAGFSAMNRDHAEKSKQKDKQIARSQTPPSELAPAAATYNAVHNSPLGPSMIASSSYKSINLSSRGDPDEPPRLITYTKHSQGFTWNDELFLPGYLLGRYGGTSRRRRRLGWGDEDEDDDGGDEGMMDSNDPERCPVTEIFVTDEEADAMMP